MQDALPSILKENLNPFTKAAFLDIILSLFVEEDNAQELVRLAVEACLDDFKKGYEAPIGAQLYLEQAASILLATIKVSSITFDEVLTPLLRNENEEVVLNCLLWMRNAKPEFISETIRKELKRLSMQVKWDGASAVALEALSMIMNSDNQVSFTLEQCVAGIQKRNARPLKEAWIVASGYAARMVRPKCFSSNG